jgi:Organic Anion Transporter Polypeptide (OATP) family
MMKRIFELPLDPNFNLKLLFIRSGASPLYTLGVTYIDENVSKKMSSVYLGEIFYLSSCFFSIFFAQKFFIIVMPPE